MMIDYVVSVDTTLFVDESIPVSPKRVPATLDDRVVLARMRREMFLDQRAEELREQIHCAFSRTRVTLGLKRFVDRSRPYRVPRCFACPECGGRILVEIDEWETRRGTPTRGGYTVMCEPDTDAMLAAWEASENHAGHTYGYGPGWAELERAVGYWLVRNVEVVA